MISVRPYDRALGDALARHVPHARHTVAHFTVREFELR